MAIVGAIPVMRPFAAFMIAVGYGEESAVELSPKASTERLGQLDVGVGYPNCLHLKLRDCLVSLIVRNLPFGYLAEGIPEAVQRAVNSPTSARNWSSSTRERSLCTETISCLASSLRSPPSR